ncbi:MAG TPA: Ig-like domain-containing protein [Thermoanaerobaculia bacterium]|nr:Ig-like domain-containing protein [Thermoanaerobaculia bacterium]
MRNSTLPLCLVFALALALAAASPAFACICQPKIPIANDDSASTPRNTAVTILVLLNDSDTCDWDSVWVVDGPSHGVATVVGDSIRYTPATDFTGTDSFTYANDAGCLQCYQNACLEHADSMPATVTVTVY